MTKTEIILNIFKEHRLTISFIIGVIFLFFSWTVPIGFILIFNFFDVLGFRNVLNGQHRQFDTGVASYRIIQNLFEIVLLLMIYFAYGLEFAIASKILHWFGAQDIVYYIVGKYKFPKIWTWMAWTPLGILKGNLSNLEIMIQFFVGIIISVLILMLL